MNINETQQLLAEADNVGHVLLIESLHGLGKSTICADYARNNNLHFEPLILSLMDVGDLIGLPEQTTVGGLNTTTWSAPDWYSRIVNAAWPSSMRVKDLVFSKSAVADDLREKIQVYNYIDRYILNKFYSERTGSDPSQLNLLRQSHVTYKHAKRSVLFIDEMNRTSMDILNASLQLILEKRLHSHILPVVNGKDTCIVAAINPADDDYTVNSFDPALLDRFVTCKLTTDTAIWLDWARSSNVHETITNFIASNPDKLHYTPNEGKGSSPRSWARLSAYMHAIDGKPTETTHNYLNGTLGEQVGAEFYLFLQEYSKQFTVEEVEKLTNKKPASKSVYRIARRLTKRIKEQEAIKRLDLAKLLEEKYIDSESYTDAMPYLAYLHALPTESLASYLTQFRKNNPQQYNLLAVMDDEATDKELFRKIIGNLL